MTGFKNILIVFIFLLTFSEGYDKDLQHILSLTINDTLATFYPPQKSIINNNPISLVKDYNKFNSSSQLSSVKRICDVPFVDSNNYDRTVCCTPSDVVHLFNIKINSNSNSNSNNNNKLNGKELLYFANSQQEIPQLPSVTSVKMQKSIFFTLPIKLQIVDKTQKFNEYCQHYFHGTLHVIGRSTTKNVYHV
eukprot:gene14182-19033_t